MRGLLCRLLLDWEAKHGSLFFCGKEAYVQLKASTDYGLRAVLYLACRGGICSSKAISEEMSIPRDYLIQLAQPLRRANIIEARPGKNGGYSLAKDPSEITLFEVIEALDDEAKTARLRRSERTSLPMAEDVRRAYDAATSSHDAYFNGITIAALLEKK